MNQKANFRYGWKKLSCTAILALMPGISLFAHFTCDTTVTNQSEKINSPSLQSSGDSELPVLYESQLLFPREAGQETGYSFRNSLEGNTLAIGLRDPYPGTSESVEIFNYLDGSWNLAGTLSSPNQRVLENFNHVKLNGDTLLVGAWNYCAKGDSSGCAQGIAYLFERDPKLPGTWKYIQYLDGGFKDGSRFANAVGLDGNVAALIASDEPTSIPDHTGVLYIFEKSHVQVNGWSLVKRFEGPGSRGIFQGSFSSSVIVDGDNIIVLGHERDLYVLGKNSGGESNWGVEQIIELKLNAREIAFDGVNLVVNAMDTCLPREERVSHLLFYLKDEHGSWDLKQDLVSDFQLRQIAVDGLQLIASGSDFTVGYMLRRDSTPDSWEFVNKLGLREYIPSRGITRAVSLDSGRAVIGLPYDESGDGLAVVYEEPAPINAGHSGAWFYPLTNGQGAFVDIEPEKEIMFVGWFTFTDENSEFPNEQQWYTAQGFYTGSKSKLDVYESLGGKFNQQEPVDTQNIGSASVSFTDCGLGWFSYTFEDGRDGGFPIQRVVPGSDNLCQSKVASVIESQTINRGMDGAWYNPDTSGQGYFVDIHTDGFGEDFIFVSWFTYGDDTESGQRWLTAQGSFSGSTADIDVYETSGGSFNTSQDVQTKKIGQMTIDFTDCSNAVLSYSLDDDSLDGQFDITRVVPGSQALCEELAGSD